MTLGVFLAVLGAAFLHALWNALIKLGTSKVGGMVILSIVEVPIGLVVVMLTPSSMPRPVGTPPLACIAKVMQAISTSTIMTT